MNQLIEYLSRFFISLYENPDKSNEICELLRDFINKTINKDTNTNITCKNVFVSKNSSDDKYYIAIIPIIEPSTKLLSTEKFNEFDVDINLSSFITSYNNGLTVDELVAWFMHELFANVITDTTLLRFKRMLVKIYDINNSNILYTVKSIGTLLNFGIFSRTKKDFIENSVTRTAVSDFIMQYELNDSWDNALRKYIRMSGGSYDILMDSNIEHLDKNQFMQFNKLARKYGTKSIRYATSDYDRYINYVISLTGSELIKYYALKEPANLLLFNEEDQYNIFNDNKIMMESSSEYDQPISTQIEMLNIDFNNIRNDSDKLLMAARIRDLVIKINEALENNPTDDHYQLMYDKVMNMGENLSKIDIPDPVNVMQLSE